MSKILIVDAQNHFYRAYFKFNNLSHKGKATGAIYGFPYLMETLIRRIKPNDVYLVWDGGKNPERVKLCPEYKAKRKKNKDYEDFERQRIETMKIMKALGVKQILKPQMEADDYIYMLVKKLKKDNEIVIASNDKDFNQLVGSSVKIWSETHRCLVTKNNMIKFFGYKPEQCIEALSIGGDHSDNIKGARGFGEKSKALKRYLLLDVPNKIIFWTKNPKVKEAIDKNLFIVSLGMFYGKYLHGKVGFKYIGKKEPKQNLPRLGKLSGKYGIKSFEKLTFLNTFNYGN